MKRLIAISALAVLASTGAYAQDSAPVVIDKDKPAVTAPELPAAKSTDVAPAPAAKMPSESATLPSSSTVGKMTLNDEEAKKWIGKTVYSSDNSNLGEVAAFKLGANHEVTGLQADIGGFLGIGETKMDFAASQFSMKDDSIVLNLTKAEVDELESAKK